jgi:hypothetical protein
MDRWRPETHTFHLPCGEMTITLEDVALIFGLPLDGLPVIGILDTKRWKDQVRIRPPEGAEAPRAKYTTHSPLQLNRLLQ